MGLQHRNYKIREYKTHINKNVKPTRRSLHYLRRLRIAHAVETSNSEPHADIYIFPYTLVMPIGVNTP